MANPTNKVDFVTKSLATLLGEGVTAGTFANVLQSQKSNSAPAAAPGDYADSVMAEHANIHDDIFIATYEAFTGLRQILNLDINQDLNVDGAVDVGTTLGVTGLTTLADAIVSGTLTVSSIEGLDSLLYTENATVPGGTPASGSATVWVNTSGELVVTDDSGTDTTFATSSEVSSLTIDDVLSAGNTTSENLVSTGAIEAASFNLEKSAAGTTSFDFKTEGALTWGFSYDGSEDFNFQSYDAGGGFSHTVLNIDKSSGDLNWDTDGGSFSITGGALDLDSNNITSVGLINSVDITSLASRFITGGADEIDGDRLDIDWNPSNYTPTTSPGQVTSLDHLTAHLAGIDSEIGTNASDIAALAWSDVLSNGSGLSGGVSPTLSSGDDLLFAADNVSDIGSGSVRPSNIYARTLIDLGGDTGISPTVRLGKSATGVTNVRWESAGNLRILNQFTASETWQIQKYDSSGVFEATSMAIFAAGGIRFDADGGGTTFVGGNVTVGDGTTDPQVYLDVNTVGVTRYDIGGTRTWETRGSASNWFIQRYVGGVFQDNAFTLRNSDGRVTIPNQFDVGDTGGTYGDGVARILAESGDNSRLVFVDESGNRGQIFHNHADGSIRFNVDADTPTLALFDTAIRPVGGAVVDIGGSTTSTYFNNLSLNGYALLGGAATSDALSSADNMIISDPGSGNVGMTLVASGSSLSTFGVNANGNALDGFFRYSPSDTSWLVRLNNTTLYRFNAGAFRPETAAATSLGASTVPFQDGHFANRLNVDATKGASTNAIVDLREDGGTTFVRHYNQAGNLRFATIKNVSDIYALQVYDTGGTFQANVYSITSAGTNIGFGVNAIPSVDNTYSLGLLGTNRWTALALSNRWEVDKVGAGNWGIVRRDGDYPIEHQYYDDGTLRWSHIFQNAGNNDGLQWRRFNSSGAFQDTALWLRGDTGDVMMAQRLFVSGAGTSGWNSGADNICIGDGTDDAGVSVYPDASGLGQFVVRTGAGGYIGAMRYDVADQRWEWAVEGSTVMYLGDDYISPDAAGASDLGTELLPFDDVHVSGSVVAQKGDANAQFALDLYSDGNRSWTLHHQTNEHLAFDRYNATTGVFEGRQLNLNKSGDIGVESRGIFGGAVLVSGAPSSGSYNGGGDDLVIGDGSGSRGLTIWPSDTGNATIYVKNSATANIGYQFYDLNLDEWVWGVDGTGRVEMTTGWLGSRSSGAMNLGDNGGNKWGIAYLDDRLDVERSADGVYASIDRDGDHDVWMEFNDEGTLRWRALRFRPDASDNRLDFTAYNSSGVFIRNNLTLGSDGHNEMNNTLGVGAPTLSGLPTGTRIAVGDGSNAAEYIAFDVTAAGSFGIVGGDSVDNDEAQFIYSMNNTRWELDVAGAGELYFTSGGIIPVVNGGQNLGNAGGFAFGTAFLSSTLAFTGSQGRIDVNGTNEIIIEATATRPATNAGQALGTSFSGWGHLTLASVVSAPGGAVARASIFSDALDSDHGKIQYGSGDITRIDVGANYHGTVLMSDPAEFAINWSDDATLTSSDLFANTSGGQRSTFGVMADAEIVVRIWALDTSNDSFGVVSCRLYEDSTGAATETETVNFNTVSTNPRTFTFSTTLTNDHLYGLTVEPSSSDTSRLVVQMEIRYV